MVNILSKPIECIKVTPAGTYCGLCGTPFGAKWWKRHFSICHPDLNFVRVENGFVDSLVTRIKRATEDPDRSSYAQDTIPAECTLCTGCGLLFTRANDARQHATRSNNSCDLSNLETRMCRKMKCGRYYPISGTIGEDLPEDHPDDPSGAPFDHNGSEVTNDMHQADNHTIQAAFEPHPTIKSFGTLPPSCMNKTGLVDQVLLQTLHAGDSPDGWRSIFHSAVAANPDGYLDEVAFDTQCFRDHSSIISSVAELADLSGAYDMLGDNFGALLSVLPGNVKAAAVKFKVDDFGETENPNRWGFRIRADEAIQRREFRPLLAFLHKRDCPILAGYVKEIQVRSLSVNQIHQEGVVIKLLFDLCMESVTSGDKLTWICRFALSRCMKIDGGEVRMKNVGSVSSMFATVLYILRQGVLASAALMQEGNDTQGIIHMIMEAQLSRSVNLLSPWINICKGKMRKEAPVKPNMYTEHGDIICGNALFKREYYSGLIPSITSDLCRLCDKVFIGDEWRLFTGEAHLKVSGDWFACDIEVDRGGAVVQMKSLDIVEGYSLQDPIHQQFTSMIELVLHGLGGGGERLTTVQRLYFKQMRMENATGDIHYNLVHDKQSSVATYARSPARHKMPRCLVPYFLLFRLLCLHCMGSAPDVIPRISRRTHMMKHIVCALFHLDPNTISDLDVRHFFATVVNILYSDPSNFGTLTADQDAAQLCNHTEATHRLFYASEHANREQIMIAMYHNFFGGNDKAPQGEVSLKPITKDIQLNALRLMCGNEASFHSESQRMMVDLCCNDRSHHKLFVLGCGEGKTMSALAPVVVEYLLKRQTGIRLFVVPYGFLKDSLHHAFTERLSPLGGNISVAALSASEISDDPSTSLPPSLTDNSCPPEIVILTLDAAANLIQYHEWILHSWIGKNMLSSVFIDEIQTIMTEFGFRRVYQLTRKYATLGCPISLLSGSFPFGLGLPVMRYLGLTTSHATDGDSLQDVNIIHSGSLICDGFDFIVTEVESSQVIGVYIARRLGASSSPIHVICKTTSMAEKLYGQLSELGADVALVHAKVPKTAQRETAMRWAQGKVDVLVSTTVALVGNENPACKEIIVLGIVYNLSALVQAMGRLRPNQRGPSSRVVQVLISTERSSHQRFTDESNASLQQLVDACVLSEDDKKHFLGLFHYENYLKLITTGGSCFLTRIAMLYGSSVPCCRRCTWCKHGTRSVDISQELYITKHSETASETTAQLPTVVNMNTMPDDKVVTRAPPAKKRDPFSAAANANTVATSPSASKKPRLTPSTSNSESVHLVCNDLSGVDTMQVSYDMQLFDAEEASYNDWLFLVTRVLEITVLNDHILQPMSKEVGEPKHISRHNFNVEIYHVLRAPGWSESKYNRYIRTVAAEGEGPSGATGSPSTNASDRASTPAKSAFAQVHKITPDKAAATLHSISSAPRPRLRFDRSKASRVKRPGCTGASFSLTGTRCIPQQKKNVINPYKKVVSGPTSCSPVMVAANRAGQIQADMTETERQARNIERSIIESCPICKSKNCDGECVKSCWVCGDGHFAKMCRYYKDKDLGKMINRFLRENGVCSLCCMPTYNDVHGVKDGTLLCPGQKRFRALIRDRLPSHELSYEAYVRKIHASRETYYKYLSDGGF